MGTLVDPTDIKEQIADNGTEPLTPEARREAFFGVLQQASAQYGCRVRPFIKQYADGSMLADFEIVVIVNGDNV